MEKRNYVIFNEYNDTEHIIKMTAEQARAVDIVLTECFDIVNCVELAEKYDGREA